MFAYELLEYGTFIHDYGRLVIQCSGGSVAFNNKQIKSSSCGWVYPSAQNNHYNWANGKTLFRSGVIVDEKTASEATFRCSLGDTYYCYWEDGTCAKIRLEEGVNKKTADEFMTFIENVHQNVIRTLHLK